MYFIYHVPLVGILKRCSVQKFVFLFTVSVDTADTDSQ